jgi:hypothetical protein
MSRKTVEMLLSSVYRTLVVTSQRELEPALAANPGES